MARAVVVAALGLEVPGRPQGDLSGGGPAHAAGDRMAPLLELRLRRRPPETGGGSRHEPRGAGGRRDRPPRPGVSPGPPRRMSQASEPAPRATVVVTCFNQEQWIEQALDSVAAQTEPDLQLIVTDDGSRDGSRARIDHWVANHDLPAEVVASERNVGLPAMLNRAMRRFRGRYVVVLNGDDWMEPDRVASQAAALDHAPETVGLVYSDLRVVDAGGAATGEVLPRPTVERRQGNVLLHIISEPMIGMPSVMFRRSVLDTIGSWDESLVADDYDFLLRVAASSFEFLYLPRVTANYRSYGDSMTGSRGPVLAEGRILALYKLLGR